MKPPFPIAALIFLVVLAWFLILVMPPPGFPIQKIVEVSEGNTLLEIGYRLEEDRAISSPLAFQFLVRLIYGDGAVIAGSYFFDKPLPLFLVASRLNRGDFGLESVWVTLPEGLSVKEIAEVLTDKLLVFDKEQFIKLALPYEGYLFPDTYYFSPVVAEEKIISLMRANFADRVEKMERDFKNTERTLEEIMVMASLLEEEARDWDDRRIISGILWKRLEDEMLLQVDAVFPYLIGKNSFELTKSDLALDSPFNTYQTVGLPPAPITNPGREAILAAIYPKESPYWFYLSDRGGNFHFGRDFEEHKANKARYLW